MSYSIIIPSKDIQNLVPCVESIKRNAGEANIIVVDDGLDLDRLGEDFLRGVVLVQGQRPFCFSRNINIGIRVAFRDDVILMNDDTRLLTKNGFGLLQKELETVYPEYGIVSPGITNAVGNPDQILQPAGQKLRQTNHHTLVFVCVYIPRFIIDDVGFMDPRFVNYGFCDDDMCARVRREGYKLGVFDRCVVEHGVLPSAYRSRGDQDLEPNRKLFVEKWGKMPQDLKF